MTDYNKQANDFLVATSTSFKAEFKKYDYYFDDDKDKRDVYRITLKNSRHTYRFNFGQAIAKVSTPPTAYDVLACLTKYEVGTFEDFCYEFGYYTDSRRAYKTYKAVLQEWKNIELLFSAEEIELLQEIQ